MPELESALIRECLHEGVHILEGTCIRVPVLENIIAYILKCLNYRVPVLELVCFRAMFILKTLLH